MPPTPPPKKNKTPAEGCCVCIHFLSRSRKRLDCRRTSPERRKRRRFVPRLPWLVTLTLVVPAGVRFRFGWGAPVAKRRAVTGRVKILRTAIASGRYPRATATLRRGRLYSTFYPSCTSGKELSRELFGLVSGEAVQESSGEAWNDRRLVSVALSCCWAWSTFAIIIVCCLPRVVGVSTVLIERYC